MLELEEARDRILAAVQPLSCERVPLSAAFGRAAAKPIHSLTDLPPFDNSAMDGYAVRASDTSSASPETPVPLKLCGQIFAGDRFSDPVPAGSCVRIFTGSPLPKNTDAVLMQEDSRVLPEKPDTVLVLEKVRPWENVRFAGEDVKRGMELLRAGDFVSAGRIDLLAATGLSEINVARQPIIGLVATGSELQEAGQPLAPGKIYESNRVGLAALLPRAGALSRIFPLVRDDPAVTRSALEEALRQCDGVITTGGVSVGELDFVKSAFEQIGGRLEFWKVAVKPGKPFVFGRWQEKLLFGLPGNPVSALVTFLLLVRPALLRWQGATDLGLPAHPGTLMESLENSGERRHFMRVKVDEKGNVCSAGTQASHILSSLAKANGLVDVPPRTTFESGTAVQVLRWNF